MRCPDCAKMVSLEFQDPEEKSLEITQETGEITAEVRIVRTCADCGQYLKESMLQFTEQLDEELVEAHQGDDHKLEVEMSLEQYESGGGRYAKSYFGAEATFRVTCSCRKLDESITEVEKVAASEMDELV